MKTFSGRVALVTGGASGIGFGIVQNFLKLGMKVVIVDFNSENLDDARRQLGDIAAARFVKADVGDREQVRAAANTAIEAFGKINVLCNNAGVGGGGNAEDADFDAWDRALRVNLGGVVNGTKIITPLTLKQGEGGHIVNTASMAGIAR
jgi:NAD(P)-dependent dehydrogenase (short-subunit alcohol dehydrogenase family)